MDIIILDRNLEYSLNLMKEISRTFKEYRVTFVSNNANEFEEYIKSNYFDIVIIEDYFNYIFNEISNYKAIKIFIFDKEFKQSSSFISIRNHSKKAIISNLSRILSKASKKNEKFRNAVKKELEYLGYNFSLCGTTYLQEAINLIYFKNCDYNLEKEVYSPLSKIYKKSAHTIKVNIQNSTNTMLSVYGYDKLTEYLGIDYSFGIGTKPIICAILNKILSNPTF